MENSVVLRKGLFDLEEYSMTLDSLLFDNLYEKRWMSNMIKSISNPTDCCRAGLVNSHAVILCGFWTK